MRILLLGDDAKNRRLLAFGLALADDEPATVGNVVDLLRLTEVKAYDVALLDWESREDSGEKFLAVMRRIAPALPVVACTTNPERAAAALRSGAVDVLMKPMDVDEARSVLCRHAQSRSTALAQAEDLSLRKAEARVVAAEAFESRSSALVTLMNVVAKVAPTSANVLILGENGTGKSRLARVLHERSPRRERPFLAVNCPCLQPQLIESELFGHVRGAFTGAVTDVSGKVAAAEGGTLFLDEIGELPLSVQAKLLRLLQERCYERIGEARTYAADIRIVAATNRNLKSDVATGRFREDLFYRLNVISLEVPALRHRPEDIVPLAEHFLHALGASHGRRYLGFTPSAQEALLRHPWPGNLRELRNTVERAAILSDHEWIDMADLPELDGSGCELAPQVGDFVTLDALAQAHIQQVMARTESLGQAARILGIDKATLYRRRKRTGNLRTGEDKLDSESLQAG